MQFPHRKNLLKGLGRLVRPGALLALAALILFGIKAARNWFDSNFAYGALNPGRTLVNSWLWRCHDTGKKPS